VLTHVRGVLTTPRRLRTLRDVGGPIRISLDIGDVFGRDEPVAVDVAASDSTKALTVSVEDTETQAIVATATSLDQDAKEWRRIELKQLPPGLYRATVTGDPAKVMPVSDLFIVP
jgi:hypothetical protein